MANIKNYILSLIIIFFITVISIVFINIFYYFNFLNENIYRFFKIFFVIISIFIGGLFIGKKSTSKGYLKGIILGLIIVTFMFISSILFSCLQFKQLLYYLVIITSSCLGGTIGIRKKKKL